MAEIFLDQKHIANFQKCWRKFFESESFTERVQGHFSYESAESVFEYLEKVIDNGLTIQNVDILTPFRDDLLEHARERLSSSIEQGDTHPSVRSFLEGRVRLIQRTLFEEEQPSAKFSPMFVTRRSDGGSLWAKLVNFLRPSR